MKRSVLLSILVVFVLFVGGCKNDSNPVQIINGPTAPKLSEPADSSVDVVRNPIFKWLVSGETDTYHLQVSTNSLFDMLIFSQDGIKITQQQISGLDSIKNYYWRVRSINSSGTSNWSVPRLFTTTLGTIPPAPAIIYPASNGFNVPNSPVIKWNASKGAISYNLQISLASNFSSLVTDIAGIKDTVKTVTGLDSAKQYFLRVYSVNRYGYSASASVTSFVTVTPTQPLVPVMVLVPSGTFTMGSTAGDSDELPLHSVTLSSYYISKTEVTQGQWKAVMGSNPSYFPGVGDNGPVEEVTWYDCISYCNKLSIKEGKTPVYSIGGNTSPGSWSTGTIDRNTSAKGYRLPTEAEWEYAARGGNQTNNYTYSGSNTVDNVAWYSSNSGSTTHLVSTRTANELGISDMSGNVWEWCWDWYGSYTSASQTNPTGASSGSSRLLRGGSWNSSSYVCRVSYRGYDFPDLRNSDLGFRVVEDF